MITQKSKTEELVEKVLEGIAPDMKRLQKIYSEEAIENETFVNYMVRKNVISSEGFKSIEMVSKGYLNTPIETFINRVELQNLLMYSELNIKKAIEKIAKMTSLIPANRTINNFENRQTENDQTKKIPKPIVGPQSNRIGTRIGRCIVTRRLGEGGGGTVYEAMHRGLGIPVAIKVIKEGKVGSNYIRALRSEARMLAHLDHPNVVRVLDFDDEGEDPFLILELVNGQSMTELLDQVGPLEPTYAAGAIAQAARGLEAAKQIGIVHRDVKPANLLISKSGTVKISDLGLAVTCDKLLQNECGAQNMSDVGLGGTFSYMAPERFSSNGPVEFYSDIYSLGVTFFELLTNRLPFVHKTPYEFMVAHATAEVPYASSFIDGVPEMYDLIIQKMMAKEPQDRYTSYNELIADLIKAVSDKVSDSSIISTWNSVWGGLSLEMSSLITTITPAPLTKKLQKKQNKKTKSSDSIFHK